MRRFLIGAAVCFMGMFLMTRPVFVRCDAKAAGVLQPASEKMKIALTFDDGPSPGITDSLLDGLAARHVKVTFFVMGQKAAEHPELLKREAQEGHLIGNHTYRHVQLDTLSKEEAEREIAAANEVIERITGREVDFIRPPFGVWNKSMEKELEMIPVLWTVDPLDWCSSDADEIVEKIVTNVKENDIILMHDDYRTSVEAALRVIDILTKQGYEFVTVEDLIAD